MMTISQKLQKNFSEKMELLFILIRKSDRSDRQLSRKMGKSNKTIAKRRKELETEGFIEEYTVIPNLQKMGFELIAFTFVKSREKLTLEQRRKAINWIEEHPNVVFGTEGEGSQDTEGVMVSVHSDYSSYLRLMEALRKEPEIAERLDVVFSFRIKTDEVHAHNQSVIYKPFTFRYLEKAILKN